MVQNGMVRLVSADRPIRTLHIDIEGGWGGSSRSLFELIKRLDPDNFRPVVAHRQEGPITERYADLGIPTHHVPQIVSFAPRPYNSWKIFLGTLPSLANLRSAARKLSGLARAYETDILHLNYEGLFLLATRLRKQTGLPIIGHSRTHIPLNFWGRWLVQGLKRNLEHLFFISPQEEARFRTLERGRALPGTVLWNIAPDLVPRRKQSTVPEAVYLGNIASVKGTDRLVDIAAALDEVGAPPLVIAIYGSERKGADFLHLIKKRVASEGLTHRVSFRGYTTEPEKVLATAYALIRPSRQNDPWGRDVIEAARSGVPVLATGSYDGVVKPEKTGFLFPEFDASEMATKLVELLRNRERWFEISEAAKSFGEEQFGGTHQVRVFSQVMRNLSGSE